MKIIVSCSSSNWHDKITRFSHGDAMTVFQVMDLVSSWSHYFWQRIHLVSFWFSIIFTEDDISDMSCTSYSWSVPSPPAAISQTVESYLYLRFRLMWNNVDWHITSSHSLSDIFKLLVLSKYWSKSLKYSVDCHRKSNKYPHLRSRSQWTFGFED